MAAYLTFLLDLVNEATDRIVSDTLRFVPDRERRPKTTFVWKVTCDARGLVIIQAAVGSPREGPSELAVIATARWTGRLEDRRRTSSKVPNDVQWGWVQAALEVASARRKADPSPYDDSLVEEVPMTRRPLVDATSAQGRREARRRERAAAPGQAPSARGRGGLVAAMLVALAGLGAIVALRCKPDSTSPAASPPAPRAPPPQARPTMTPPPPVPETVEARVARADDLRAAMALAQPALTPVSTGDFPSGAALLARYRVTWADLDRPDETTIAKVEKDPISEQGKQLCVEGELDRITRRDLDDRTYFVGAMRTAQGDRVTFLAAGATGDLVKRARARLCGVVTGTIDGATALFGMFDLPDNREPPVELRSP
ncbi:MAG: hypothetical protein IPL61_31755 [Myxococcales bacterium]|nr:hypothetical protein [Myxococcales bacterium]